jgi:superfamily II DNA or RNA helicase
MESKGRRLSTNIIKPRQHQVDLMNFTRTNNMLGTLAWHGMGLGKAMSLDQPVHTPRGFRRMGDIRVGDAVTGMDGHVKEVLGVYPQGIKSIYEITFSDGTTTRSCDEHLWTVRTSKDKYNGKPWQVKELKDIMSDLNTAQGFSKWMIPITKPVLLGTPINSTLPSYLLGVMIGDGCLGHDCSITNASDHIFNRIKDYHFENIEIKRKWIAKDNTYKISFNRIKPVGLNIVQKSIKDLKLNVNSNKKFIPKEYLDSPLTERILLLQGLIDTDGYVSKDGLVQYTSASKRLIDDFSLLIQSMGGTSVVHHKKTNMGTDAWTSTIRLPNNMLKLCATKPDKKKRLRVRTKYFPVRFIRSVEYIGEKECQCISVEDEHYLTDNFIVTHNTLSALWTARDHLNMLKETGQAKAPKVAILCPKSAIVTWRDEIKANVKELLNCSLVYSVSSAHHFIKSCKYHDVRYLIIDESHALKSPETNRAQVISKLLKEIGTQGGRFKNGRIFLLTGTPMPNGAHELYTSYALCGAPDIVEAGKRLVDIHKYKEWEYSFADRKSNTFKEFDRSAMKKVKKQKTSPEGAKNVPMLGQLLAGFTHYRRVTDCLDIPKPKEIHINLGLPDDALLKDAKIEKPEAYMAVVERLSRAKTPHMLGWIQEFIRVNPTTQLLIFTMHRNPLDQLQAYFKNRVRLITGKEKRSDRDQSIHDFKAGKFQLFGMTYKCGSESLNLQNAYNSLYHGYPWTDSTLRQAMARTYRSGQRYETNHFFLTSGNNDSRVLGLVRAKQEATNEVEDMLIQLEKARIDQAMKQSYSSII